MPERPYTYYDFTLSLCPHCLRRIEAKIVFEDGGVYMLKRCPEHGRQKVRIATDIEYYKSIRNYVKPSETPRRFNMATHYGCPYDCGLCTDHEQHSCLTVIEVTDRCNLTCPTCYAESSPYHGRHRTLEEIEAMVDLVVANEGEPDVVQLSGGEPTLHPQFWEILDMCKRKPIKHLMVNTNGIRLAKDEAFVARLATYAGAFEVYLQFDSFRDNPDVPFYLTSQLNVVRLPEANDGEDDASGQLAQAEVVGRLHRTGDAAFPFILEDSRQHKLFVSSRGDVYNPSGQRVAKLHE